MVTYIYFVKCPNCEDEHFDFFDDAKSFAMSRLSDKPVITQTEVCRNDFGECTESSDLGTVWSWEDMMGDLDTEETKFSKAETFGISEGVDDLDDFLVGPQSDEFADIDNSVDFEIEDDEFADESFDDDTKSVTEDTEKPIKYWMCFYDGNDVGVVEAADEDAAMEAFEDSYRDSLLFDSWDHDWSVDEITKEEYDDYEGGSYGGYEYDNELDYKIDQAIDAMNRGFHEGCKKDRKPVPEGMTIEQLKETMEENEDTVECAGCEELFPKEECFHKEGVGYLCGNCEDRIVKCTWCEELYDKGECRYEVDLGWLCDRCEAAIKSRGETLTFREGNYWDFLDEAATKANWHKAGPKLFRLTTDKGTAEVYQNTHGIFELSVRDKSGKYLVGGNMRIGGSTVPEDETHKTKAAAMKTAEKYLVENFSSNETNSLAVIVKDSINHLTNDLGKDPWAEDFVDDVIKDIENNYDVDVPTNPKQYSYFCDAVAKEVSFQLNKSDDDVDFDNVFNMEF